jgi:myo-inositol 2-dehydrogenase / D-chiro-inositol 1-dehydrogenase
VTTPLRYGVIGTGMMGIEHIENILALDATEVTAVADPFPASLEHAARVIGQPPRGSFVDHRDLLASGLCDVVVVATPNMTHADILTDALAIDELHVLVEKPLCTTVEDCWRVLEAAEGRSGKVWMGLEYRYMPAIARLVDHVRRGEVGRVRMVAIREHRFPFLHKVHDWNRFNRNTGGTLVEKCCHFFDLMNLLTGSEAVRVMASGAQDVNHFDEEIDGEVPDVLDNALVIVDYADGSRASLDLCMFAEASHSQEEVVVVGDVGKAEAFLPDGTFRHGLRARGRPNVEVETVHDDRIAHEGLHHGASFLEHLEFAESIRHDKPVAVTLGEGMRSVAIGVAAHRSIDEGRVVPVDEVLGR